MRCDRAVDLAVAIPLRYGDLIDSGVASLSVAGVDTARLDCEVLLAHAVGVNRAGVFARLRDEAPRSVIDRFEALLARRAQREPVAYIVCEKEFCSLMFRVTDAVLIPRPETELLVETVVERAPVGGHVLEVGTGSGCVAIAIAAMRPDLSVTACDISPAALSVAEDNAVRLGIDSVRFFRSDLFDGVGGEVRFDVVASNPPYVADDFVLEPELDWEPSMALRAGSDGMAVIDPLLTGAPARLNSGGYTIVEIGSDQERSVRSCAAQAGFGEVEILRDLAGHPRLLVAKLGSEAVNG